ncbi:zinc ribbon domain-containing protein [Lysinibacter cavernae]|uniref:CT398-like coiled coil hairpin domain-containing protein n=1 Tax=Lysinibacter cavernae TaxID=1640652 RepID=A0A7X5QZ36_9MICO|nr:hypothetical protein [Lysinibacter cavernae]NIH52636.1 hypothetical protein [Lysinibacter cavernae]
MKASQGQQKKLLDVQAVDNRLGRLNHQEKTLPERKALSDLQAGLSSAKETAIRARGIVEASQLEIRRLEDDVATVRARAARDEQRMATSTNSKEAVVLEGELETLARRTAELEEVTLVVMERLEAEEAVLAEAEAALAGINDQRIELEKKIAEAIVSIGLEREEATDQRQALVAEIDPELLSLYEETRQRYGIGAALIRRGISEGSNMALTESDLASIRAAAPDEIIFCKDSGAILVRTNESGL